MATQAELCECLKEAISTSGKTLAEAEALTLPEIINLASCTGYPRLLIQKVHKQVILELYEEALTALSTNEDFIALVQGTFESATFSTEVNHSGRQLKIEV